MDDSLINAGKQWPKITIVTPSYNQGEFLEETILSIINQKYPNLEYIIIDGGSTDNSVEIIKKYEQHIQYWVSEKDFGQSHAINKGFAIATGVILNWINSDDLLCENAFFSIGEAYLNRKNDNVLIIGNGYVIDENSKIVSKRNVEKDENSTLSLKIKGKPIQQSIFFSRSLLLESGGINPMLKFPMDIDLYYKFGYLNPEIIAIPEYIGSFRKHSNSKTVSQDYKMLLEKINLIKYLSFYSKNQKEYLSQIGSYIAAASFEGISFKQKWQLFREFIKVTSFNKKNRYKFRAVLRKIIK